MILRLASYLKIADFGRKYAISQPLLDMRPAVAGPLWVKDPPHYSWNRIPKTWKTMGRKEPGPHNPVKTWPGEAHEQPQLDTAENSLPKTCKILKILPILLTLTTGCSTVQLR